MITLERDRLVFRFPEVHPDAAFALSFQRTLRIPDDGRDHHLPPGLGCFPLRHVDDYADRLPPECKRRGGILLPMYQAEALWLDFDCYGVPSYPMAVKVATGKINAVTGGAWSLPLGAAPQDYLALPEQPWLDGYCVEKGIIRQFVAAPMGRGITVEEQISGNAEWGGMQILAYPMKAQRYEKLKAEWEKEQRALPVLRFAEALHCDPDAYSSLGLAAGGRMRQHICDDEYGVSAWDQAHAARCFITILDSHRWTDVTGEAVPSRPITAADYAAAGLPWFDYYADAGAVAGSPTLAGVKSISNAWKEPPADAGSFTAPMPAPKVVALGHKQVREMDS